MEVDSSDPAQNELRGYLDALWRRKWWIVASVVVTVGLASLYGYRAAKVYATTSQIVVSDPAQSLVFGTGSSASSQNPDRYVADQLLIIRSQGVTSEVARAMGPRSRLIRAVTAQQVGKTDVVS